MSARPQIRARVDCLMGRPGRLTDQDYRAPVESRHIQTHNSPEMISASQLNVMGTTCGPKFMCACLNRRQA